MRADRRTYAREYAQRKRDARFAAERRTAHRCPKRWGKHPCGGPLTTTTDGHGGTITTCAWCERHARGLCLECPRPVVGRAKRCPEHLRIERSRAGKRYLERHGERARARNRELYMRPEPRARRNAYKRAWRKLHPDLVKQQKRRVALRQPQHVLDYMRRYRAKHREHYRRTQLARYYQLHPVRPDTRCEVCGGDVGWSGTGRPAKRCDAHVPPCIRRAREERRTARVVAATEQPVRRVRVPKGITITGEGTHRCCVPGCTSVLQGRTKKCMICAAKDRVIAQIQLAGTTRRRST